MKITKIYCDLCGQETAHTPQSMGASPLRIETCMDSQNPMSEHADGFQHNQFILQEVCPDCQRAIATTLSNLLTQLKK